MPTKPKINFFGPDDGVASGRYRKNIPYNWLINNGWESGDDVLITMKHKWPCDPTKDSDKYIFDVCDDHFMGKFRDHYLKHCFEADIVTCNSNTMRSIIQANTGRTAKVIPDPVEYPREAPHYSKSFLLFGNEWNVKILQSVPGLLDYIKDYPLQVISTPFAPFVTPWSREAMIKGFANAGAVLIPVGKKIAKSANRLIESINAGCFVIANPMPAYDEFGEFAWVGDIAEGVEWYLNNKEEALERVSAGQEYIDGRYTINQIGPMWEDAIGAC